MKKLTRQTFIKQCANIGTVALIAPYSTSLFAGAAGSSIPDDPGPDNDLIQRLLRANDKQVSRLLQPVDIQGRWNNRRFAHDLTMLSSSFCHPESEHYQNPLIVPKLEKIAESLMELQTPDGTLDSGNLGSPPDTGFVLEPLCAGVSVLMQNNWEALDKTKQDIKRFIVNAGEALATGGIHTPNHRWVVCSALAWINSLYPDQKYVDRVNAWLADGIFIDSDGHYPERSRNYSPVENRSLITMGRLLSMPELFEPVRKNLEMTYYYMEPNGDLVTNDSRRQDQYSSRHILSYYLHYRYLAIRDNNSSFATITKLIETFEGFDQAILNRALVYFLEEPLFQKKLPESSPVEVDYEKLFVTSHLLRIRREDKSITLFGGVDWPLIIASGRSNSPDFFAYRKGEAILKYARLSSRFFSMGYFYSEGLKKEGGKYILYQKKVAPYYQPMPAEKRNANGDYKLSQSIDGRYWSKMSFEDRPVSNVKTQETTIILEEVDGSAELTFQVGGPDNVMVTIELCFEEGGELSGVVSSDDQAENYFLEEGTGQYNYGKDTIHFEPGKLEHKYINRLEGERYSTHRGTLRTDGMHVYLTGMTPFEHTLTFS
jgi:hypothetical protein